MGRPWLDKELTAQIVQVLAAGNTITDTCAYVGIATTTYHHWIARGEQEMARRDAGMEADPTKDIYVTLVLEAAKARAQARVRAVTMIQSAMADNWQAAAWFLERSAPKDWARTTKSEVTGKDGGALQVEAVTPDALEAKITAYLETLTAAGALPPALEDAPTPPEETT